MTHSEFMRLSMGKMYEKKALILKGFAFAYLRFAL